MSSYMLIIKLNKDKDENKKILKEYEDELGY